MIGLCVDISMIHDSNGSGRTRTRICIRTRLRIGTRTLTRPRTTHKTTLHCSAHSRSCTRTPRIRIHTRPLTHGFTRAAYRLTVV